LLLAEIMKLSANIIIFYLAMLLPRSSLVSAGPNPIIPAAPATPKVTAESQFITGAEAGALTAGVAAQVLGAAIDTTLLQVSGVVNGAVGLSEPPVITGENFQVVSTQLGNAQFILGSISGLSDTTGGQGVDFPTPIAFPVIPPP
jgi:lipoprotein-anchoring transpeptidase ErfK/SrfK